MNGKQEIITIDKLIPQPSSTVTTDATVSEGSGDTNGAQDLVSFKSKTEMKKPKMKPSLVIENDYIMIPVDVLDQYRAKKPKKVKKDFQATIRLTVFKIDLASLKRDVDNLKMKLESVESN